MKMSWPEESDSSDSILDIYVSQLSRDSDCNMNITCLIPLNKYDIFYKKKSAKWYSCKTSSFLPPNLGLLILEESSLGQPKTIMTILLEVFGSNNYQDKTNIIWCGFRFTKILRFDSKPF